MHVITLKNIFFIVSFIWLIAGAFVGLNIYDEGIILVGARRLIDGALPYLDFWTIYPPGIYYFTAFIQYFISEQVLIVRLIGLLVIWASGLEVLFLFKKYSNGSIPYIAFHIFILFFGSIFYELRAVTYSLFFILSSFLFLHAALEKNNLLSVFICGLFVSVVTLFRHDFGAYTLFSFLVILISMLFKRDINFRFLLTFAFGFLFLFLPFLVILISSVGVNELVQCLIIDPANVMSNYRNLTLPNPLPFAFFGNNIEDQGLLNKLSLIIENISFYFPLMILMTINTTKLLKKKIDSVDIGLTILSIFMFYRASNRPSLEHLFPMVLIIIILIAKNTYILRSFNFKYLVLAMAVLMILIPNGKKIRTLINWSKEGSFEQLHFKNSKYIISNKKVTVELNALEKFVDSTNYKSYIYSGVTRHDKFVINNTIIYYLIPNPIFTKFHELHPGITTEIKNQIIMIKEFKKLRPRYLFLYKWDIFIEPNLSSRSSGILNLDYYIAENYKFVKIIGDYIIMEQK